MKDQDILDFSDITEALKDVSLADFSMESEKPEPRVADGVYKGHVVDTSYVGDSGYLNWKISLQGNEGLFCDDGISTVDGSQVEHRLWFPIKGDESKKAKFGAMSEWQNKVNIVVKFCRDAGLVLNNPKQVLESLIRGVNDRSFIGFSVVVTVKNVAGKKEHAGKIFTRVIKMEKGA